jgi:septal ring factor EnvC (AmiA/AmiB activator)
LPTPGGTYPIWNAVKYEPREIKDDLKKDTSSNNSLQKKIDELIKRLDALEKQHKSKPNNQEEILAFVGTGIFVIFSLSLLK